MDHFKCCCQLNADSNTFQICDQIQQIFQRTDTITYEMQTESADPVAQSFEMPATRANSQEMLTESPESQGMLSPKSPSDNAEHEAAFLFSSSYFQEFEEQLNLHDWDDFWQYLNSAQYTGEFTNVPSLYADADVLLYMLEHKFDIILLSLPPRRVVRLHAKEVSTGHMSDGYGTVFTVWTSKYHEDKPSEQHVATATIGHIRTLERQNHALRMQLERVQRPPQLQQ